MPKGGAVRQYNLESHRLGSVRISNTATEGLDAWSEQAQGALTEQMVRTCNSLRNGMNRRLVWRSARGAPGGRATGQLARSIAYNVKSTPHRIEGEVGAGVDYAKYIEGWNSRNEHKPIERHFVPFDKHPGLLKWALRHGVRVYRSTKTGKMLKRQGKYGKLGGGLMIGGPDFPSPFMQPELEAQTPQIQGRFAAALARTMNG